MRTLIVCLLALVLPVSCLTPPKPWVPDGQNVDSAELSADVSTEADAPVEVKADNHADEKTDLADESKDAIDSFADQSVDGGDMDVDESADKHTDESADYADEGMDKADEIDALDEGVPEIDIADQTETPDVPDCPPGYSWDAEKGKCVSFCPADQYFEAKLMKCVFYPCCDLTGAWKASVLDTDTMAFTIYDLQVDQTISYLQALLTLDSPPEVAECSGSLEKKELLIFCSSETYSLQLSSTTVDGTGKFSGFYSYSYKKGGVKAGPVNFEKK